MFPVAVAQSTSGVIAILPVLCDDIMFFFYNRPYSGIDFTTKDRFCLNLLIYHKVRQNSISYY